MNILRSIIRMARANPRWALIALSLDISIGAIAATVVYFLWNTTGVAASSLAGLAIGGLLVIIGIIVAGYTVFIRRFEGLCTQDLGDPVYDSPEEGEHCASCGAEWTGTSDG